MNDLSISNMLKAGIYFGHNKSYANPKMNKYVYMVRNKIQIINLEKTLPLFNKALNFIKEKTKKGAKILLVGTKNVAGPLVKKYGMDAEVPYVDYSWSGGFLTNWKTVKQSIKTLNTLQAQLADGTLDKLSKKEAMMKKRHLQKLENRLTGIQKMTTLPDVLFIIDTGFEKTAVAEAKKLGIPVIGIVDTNNNPDDIDMVIPGNDDSIKAVDFYLKHVTQAIIEARSESKQKFDESVKAQFNNNTSDKKDSANNDNANESISANKETNTSEK